MMINSPEQKGSLRFKAKVLRLDDDPEISKNDVLNLIKENQISDLSSSDIDELFNAIDIDKAGKIRKSVLLLHISNNKELARTSIKDDIEFHFLSESEKVLNKLISLKKLCNELNQSDAVKDIDWILDTLTNKELDEYDFNLAQDDNEEFDALRLYSKADKKNQRDKDIKNVNISLKKNTSTKNCNNISSIQSERGSICLPSASPSPRQNNSNKKERYIS
jgi:hypothetical protein